MPEVFPRKKTHVKIAMDWLVYSKLYIMRYFCERGKTLGTQGRFTFIHNVNFIIGPVVP